MKKVLLIASLLFIGVNGVKAQGFVTDINGKPVLTKNYSEVQGDPNLYKDWVNGLVKFNEGKPYRYDKLNYDQLNDNLLFLSKTGEPFNFIDPVSEFTLSSGMMENQTFRNNYPAAKNTTEKSFFQVLADGKVQFLKRSIKSIIETKEYNSTAVKTFVPVISYYIFKSGQMIPVKKDKKIILAVLSDKAAALEKYIDSEKISFKDDSDISKLIGYYNTINQRT
ncbi:hypothetical protein [Hufsiella ginkgonis]|uniref:GLPGLI family protein n=1 Tax=Hufsiella ginkgonis TaxID=2695274 RepID=A0A7K1XXD4_9SPHI|nr:hypothetical protein [Hufsiella ginkgonis]MXV15389.1 hypothetical protein [Hufsiella ginkgonis]